jgi:hypothetical protein
MMIKRKNPATLSWTWTIIVVLLIMFFGLGILLIPSEKTEYPDYIAESPSPTGVKAFYTYVKSLEIPTQVWERPVEQLSYQTEGQLMLLIEPDNMFNEEEQKKWKDWMQQGNHIWLVSKFPEGFFDIKTDLHSVTLREDHLQKIGKYKALVDTNLRLHHTSNDEIIYEDEAGVIAMERSYGRGGLTVLITPEWFQNGQILKQHHLELLMPLLNRTKPELIWFNDYIHGYESQWAIIEAYPQWLLLILAQILLVILLWLWAKGKRFGPIITPREWTVRFGDERIKAQAVWYQKGEFYEETLLHQIEYVRLAIQEKWGLSTNLAIDEFVELSKRRLSSQKQSVWERNWAEIGELMSKGKLSHKQFLRGSKLIDDIRKEVQE